MSATYYPIQRRWRRLRQLYECDVVLEVMYEQMEVFAKVQAEIGGQAYRPRPFTRNLRPADYERCDWWRRSFGRRGPHPSYWAWCCLSACHWLATPNLFVISMLEPARPWQIATSDKHSTVVDLERKLIFDTNWQALQVSPEDCWQKAVVSHSSRLLPVGQYMQHNLAALT